MNGVLYINITGAVGTGILRYISTTHEYLGTKPGKKSDVQELENPPMVRPSPVQNRNILPIISDLEKRDGGSSVYSF
jgi:hypothetical protein